MVSSTPLRCNKMLGGHTRSVSLPSRSHPLIPQFNEHLHRLKPNCVDSSNNTTALPSISKQLSSLEDMYNCVDDLLLLPHTQQVFAQNSQEKWVEETMDGYLQLVDACATAKDFILHAKQDVQDLLSVLRRRRDDTDDLCGLILASRKNSKKTIHKTLKNINSFKNKPTNILGLDKNQETIAIVSMLKETESVTLDLIEALLCSVAGSKGHSRTSGWTLVSRLMVHTRKINNISAGQDHHKDTLEFEELDTILSKLVGFRTTKYEFSLQFEDLQQQLREMDSSIQVVEERLESLFKRLIKTRVSLLNMLSQ